MRKAFPIIKKILTWALIAVSAAMMLFSVLSMLLSDRTDRALFGVKALIVRSDSMSKTDFSAGDLILLKKEDPAALREGDIIAYISTNAENYGETVTHKIRRLTRDETGAPGFITYGTTTDTDDRNIVSYANVLGKYRLTLPGIGRFLLFLKSTAGYFLCIFLPFFLLILMQAISSITLFRKYRAQQREEAAAEKAALEAERLKSLEMLAQLTELKNRLRAADSGEDSQTAVFHTEGDGEVPAAGGQNLLQEDLANGSGRTGC